MAEKDIESMLAQLITMVGSIREEQLFMKAEQLFMKAEQLSMKEEFISMKEEQQAMRQEIKTMHIENESRHKQVMDKLHSLVAENELTWEKSTRNERELGKLKKLLKL